MPAAIGEAGQVNPAAVQAREACERRHVELVTKRRVQRDALPGTQPEAVLDVGGDATPGCSAHLG